MTHAADAIGVALPCGKEGSAGGLAGGPDLTRFTIDTKRFPEATCNDGTPAVFYYGRHTRAEDKDKWIIFLQGGGSCGDGQKCAERWCSIDSNFGMDKMSTSLSKPSIRGGGFLSPAAENSFGTWNRVLIYYCSSDGWAGTKTITLQATLGAGRTRDYDIHFKGSRIVDAVLDTLRNESAGKRRSVSRTTVATAPASAAWPNLDTATAVIFAGSSGGGNGVRHNADRVGAKLRATNPTLADYRAIIDAVFGGQSEKRDYSTTTLCAADPLFCRYDTFTKTAWERTSVATHGTRADASCLQWHSQVEPGTEWRCADSEHVVLHHVTTPFFLRADLLDSNLSDSFVEQGFGTRSEFAMSVESELRNLPVPEDPRPTTPGLFVPQCTDHEAITNNREVFDVKVNGFSFHDTVRNWWVGAAPQQVIRMFTGTAAAAPECPR